MGLLRCFLSLMGFYSFLEKDARDDEKFFIITGLVIVILIVAVGIIMGFYLGPIAKLGIQQMGPK